MDNLEKEREEIIEISGIHFKSLFNISPLAGKILGLLIVDGRQSGLTFESIVKKLSASKSSISTNLNLLLKMEKMNYFTLTGDRKKYFKAAPLSERLLNYKKMITSETLVIEKLVFYHEKTVSCAEEKYNLENFKAYKNNLMEVEELLMKTIAKFKIIEINNSNH
jgi:DNA-binding transcriptional regulator GbsR (MarR family)